LHILAYIVLIPLALFVLWYVMLMILAVIADWRSENNSLLK